MTRMLFWSWVPWAVPWSPTDNCKMGAIEPETEKSTWANRPKCLKLQWLGDQDSNLNSRSQSPFQSIFTGFYRNSSAWIFFVIPKTWLFLIHYGSWWSFIIYWHQNWHQVPPLNLCGTVSNGPLCFNKSLQLAWIIAQRQRFTGDEKSSQPN